ncbi:unnamed protein product [Sympodiomycopsis kandeliae]
MADVLDYGDPEGVSRAEAVDDDDEMYQPPQSRFEDEKNADQDDPWGPPAGADADDDMDMTADHGTGPAIDRPLRPTTGKKRPSFKGPHMYAFPKELAVEAGNNREPTAAAASDNEAVLEGPSDVEIPPLVPDLIGGPKDVRLTALHLTGQPISKLSTSRVFAYVSHFGAQPLGVEWINDVSINVVFPNAEAARIALEYLCPSHATAEESTVPLPTTQDIQEAAEQHKNFVQSAGAIDQLNWSHSFIQLLLLQRKCHRFPKKLLTGVEKDALAKAQELVDLTNGPSNYPDEAPEIYRELEEQDRVNHLHQEWSAKIKDVKTLQGTVWARYAIESADVKPKQAKMYSQWYREHGKDAGKEVVPKLLEVGAEQEKRELFTQQQAQKQPQSEAGPSNGQWGNIRFGGVISENNTRGRGAGQGRAVMDSYDDTMNKLRDSESRTGYDRSDRRSASPVQRRGRGMRGYDVSTLDDEMDSYNAARTSASPPLSRGGPEQSQTSSSSFSRNGPGGRQGGRGRYGDDVMMDIAGGNSDHNSSSGGGGSSDTGIKVKGRGRRKAPQPASSGGMRGWGDEEDVRPDLFGPPTSYNNNNDNGSSTFGYNGDSNKSHETDGGGRARGKGRHRNNKSNIVDDNDIFKRAGFSRSRHDAEEEAKIVNQHVGVANLLRKGGHGAGGYAEQTLASRLAANGTTSLHDRIKTDSNDGSWD